MSDKQPAPDNDDAGQVLNFLWQQQQTETVAVEELQQKWFRTKHKQRWYFAIDIVSVFLLLAALYFMFDKMGVFARIWMTLLTVFAALTAVYFSYLRRFALSWSNAVTDSYIEQLKQQLHSNIRIAKLNRDMSLWMVLAMIMFYLGMFYFDDVVAETAIRKGLISLAVLAVFTPPFWWWAHRRAKRFRQELINLEQTLQDDKMSH